MSIPDKAFHAATDALEKHSGSDDLEWVANDARVAVEAAAPFIAAQALNDYADELEKDTRALIGDERLRRHFRIRALRLRASKYERDA